MGKRRAYHRHSEEDQKYKEMANEMVNHLRIPNRLSPLPTAVNYILSPLRQQWLRV